MKDKWEEYGTYENWKSSNSGWLETEHKELLDEKYTWVMPDTYVSFDDFCMGKWQSLN